MKQLQECTKDTSGFSSTRTDPLGCLLSHNDMEPRVGDHSSHKIIFELINDFLAKENFATRCSSVSLYINRPTLSVSFLDKIATSPNSVKIS